MPQQIVVADLTALVQKQNKYYTLDWNNDLVNDANAKLSEQAGKKVRLGSIRSNAQPVIFDQNKPLNAYGVVMGQGSNVYSCFITIDDGPHLSQVQVY